ncbi:uncharacterized protein LOC122179567 isoform X2 [Lagopus leucura]|uniref:uncharacterized protein LOC122179567 isoform X2 n=1 Tax=Lagopus leucura TaxID=30410 RepID=UPI001C67A961|nr:uncharacterized protein LOC122179567 isoform X2 [Lagopus leucura]
MSQTIKKEFQVCVVSISRRKYDVQSSKSEKNSAFSKASLSEVGLSLKEPDVPTSVCRLRTDRSCWIQLHFLGLMSKCITKRGSKNSESAPCGHSAVFEWLMCSRDLSGKCLGIILQGLHRSSVLVTKLYLDAAVSRRLKHLRKISLGHVTDLSYVLPQCYCFTLVVCMDTEKSNGELCIWFWYQTSDCCTPV